MAAGTGRLKDRGTVARAVLAPCAAWALLAWAHVAVVDPAGFALVAGCAVAAVALAGPRTGTGTGPDGRARPAAMSAAAIDGPGGDALGAEREALRRLEAELHALEDQLASSDAPDGARPAEAARGTAPTWPWAGPSAGPIRG